MLPVPIVPIKPYSFLYINILKGFACVNTPVCARVEKSAQSAHRHKENQMCEKTIEQKFVKAVKAMGGIAPKFVSPGFDGMPDRLVLLPNGIIAFVEVKRNGEKPRPLQEARHELLRRLGFEVYILDDGEQIPGLLTEIRGDLF